MHITLEVEVSEREPPQGSLRTPAGRRRPFAGWLQLIGLLQEELGEPAAEAAVAELARTDRVGGRDGGGAA
jgi:hypothetical protein